MQFRYKINVEVDVLFDVPLLGADTTIFGREMANAIAKESLDSLIDAYKHASSSIEKTIEQPNLKGKVTGNIVLQTARGQS